MNFTKLFIAVIALATSSARADDQQTSTFEHLNLLAASQGMFSSGAIDLGGEKFYSFTKQGAFPFMIFVPITVKDDDVLLAFKAAYASASMTAAAYQKILEQASPSKSGQHVEEPKEHKP
jgi:hypothetical protein